MYRQHNTTFRSVNSDLPAKILGDAIYTMNKEEQAKFLASHGYPLSMRDFNLEHAGQYVDDYVFVSPTRAQNAGYAEGDKMIQVQLQRPFSFENPTKWHIDADCRPTIQSVKSYASKIGAGVNGITSPAVIILNEYKASHSY